MLCKRAVQFQSTLPHGSDLILPIHRNYLRYFNPRSLTGATPPIDRVIAVPSISIHAPSRERPSVVYILATLINISIHAPSRERPFRKSRKRFLRKISIHAPSRERLSLTDNILQFLGFQSTLPHGSDILNFFLTVGLIFQSTLPHGSDMVVVTVSQNLSRFQSTLPHGSDYFGLPTGIDNLISIHAPSRERPGCPNVGR